MCVCVWRGQFSGAVDCRRRVVVSETFLSASRRLYAYGPISSVSAGVTIMICVNNGYNIMRARRLTAEFCRQRSIFSRRYHRRDERGQSQSGQVINRSRLSCETRTFIVPPRKACRIAQFGRTFVPPINQRSTGRIFNEEYCRPETVTIMFLKTPKINCRLYLIMKFYQNYVFSRFSYERLLNGKKIQYEISQ